MKIRSRFPVGKVFLAALALVAFSLVLTLDTAQAADPPAAKHEEMAPPKPGPEHAMLAKCIGKWKSTMTMRMDPAAPPMVMEGTDEVTSICGGLWTSTMHDSPGAMPMQGHGVDGWDTLKKKYVGVWVDSWGTSMLTYEGTADATGKKITGSGSAPDMTGKMTTYNMVSEWVDDNTRTFKLWSGPMQGEPGLEIVYKRM